jgi:outer membrane protein assembly factor BamB
MLACRRQVDGSLQWKVETGKEFHVVPNFFGVGASPVIYRKTSGSQNKLVIVQVGGSARGESPANPQRLDLVKGLDSGLVAFDIENGREVWRTSSELASYSTPLLHTFDGEDRLLAWMRDRLLLVDPESGAVKDSFFWRAEELFSVVAATPVVHGVEVLLSETYGPGSVLLGIENDLFVERRRDPPRSRHRNSLRCHWATPVLHEGCVYSSTGRNSGDALFVCADWETGELLWKEPGLGRAGCALVDGVLIVLSEFGELLLIKASRAACEIINRCEIEDRQSGDTLLNPPCWAAPVVAHGYLYVRGAGKLVCIDLTHQ